MCGALDPIGAICGPYGEGVGTRVCVGPWLLEPGEKKKKKLGLGGGIVFVVGFGWIRKCFPYLVSFVMENIVITVVMIKLTMVFKGLMNH